MRACRLRARNARYEALATAEERLQFAIHPMQPLAGPGPSPASGPLFRPAWALYAGGATADLRNASGDLSTFARWVATALDMVDGLAWLTQPPARAA